MLVQIKAEELKRLKQQVLNYRQTIRNHDKTKKVAEAKESFNDTEKLIIVEGVLLQVLDTRDQSIVTRIVFSKLSDDVFWSKHKHDSIEKIIEALKKSVI